MTIAELRAGGEVEGVFACTRKDRLTAKNGSPYLAVELRDRTGAIPGRAFRDADFLAAQFERGDLVTVSGRVERFRDELQVELKTIKRARADASDPAEFLPVAYRDMEELDGFLEHLSRERPSVIRTCGRVDWKSKKSSGSMTAKRCAPSAEPTKVSAAEAASPASFQPLNAHTRAGARSPSGRRSHCRGCTRSP